MPTASPATLPAAPRTLPPLTAQADLLVSRGVVGPDVLAPDALRSAAAGLEATAPDGALLVVHPRLLPPSALAGHLRRTATVRRRPVERAGFVVVDMPDVDEFAPVPGVDVPDADVYAVAAPDRGDDMANWSPEEAAPEIAGRGSSPLTLAEGIHWALQAPAALERNLCFMTIGSRLRRADGTYDARTPAVWISNGTGRDGSERRGAPKVGWCWWRNRHTWLGFASTSARTS
ncbi:DUF5701 family protein [Isoptericola cucumis]|uniref:Uncharacterized protein n=2 Tax=Isoptericola cucumis TaxID=1776856 RepID=A0ABQ2BD46_9MICO|nr:DUF5701 family protein [Isoptericola cucumis]GGI11345.1 hypothetical protein GCM10007368_35740 [Isoptericola cucumis]